MKRNLIIRLLCAFCTLFVFVPVLSSCQTSKPWEGMEPEEIPSLMKVEFEVKPGMKREEVESVLGKPTHVGRTKEGYSFAQYEDDYHIRSVVYNYDGSALESYPY